MKNKLSKTLIVVFVILSCVLIEIFKGTNAIYRDVLNTKVYLSVLDSNQTYRVTFNSDGGSAVNPIDVAQNTAIGTLPIPTKTNYNFVGWYTQDGNTKLNADTIITSNVTYYAHWAKIVCKNAKSGTLHTATCSSSTACGASVNSNNESLFNVGDTITYGTIPGANSPLPGDAYDCDVNGDDIWNPATERFYFIREYTDSNYTYNNVVLVHYTNFDKDGQTDNSTSREIYTYDAGKTYLPSTTFPNQSLLNPSDPWTNSAIISFDGKKSRYITKEDLIAACGPITYDTFGYLDSCIYFMENSRYESANTGRSGIVVEKDSDSYYRIDTRESRLSKVNSSSSNSVRPVIEIPYNTLEGYQEKTTYNISFDTHGAGNITHLIRYENQPIGTLPTPEKEGYKFLGWFTTNEYQTEVTSTDLVTSNMTLHAKWGEEEFQYVFRIPGTCTFGGANGTITSSSNDCISTVNHTNGPIDYTTTTNKYIDTHVSLYSETNYEKDYEVGFTITSLDATTNNPNQATFFNTKLENSSLSYPGLVFRKTKNTGKLEITETIKGAKAFNDSLPYSNPITSQNPINVKIVRESGIIKYSYNDGPLIDLQDINGTDDYFKHYAWFGSAGTAVGRDATTSNPDNNKFASVTLSNMYIKLKDPNIIKHNVTFNAHGGNASFTTKQAKDGIEIGDLPTVTKSGYYFNGWYTEETAGRKIDETEVITRDETYHAQYKNIYIVTFNPEGGTLSSEANTIEVVDGESIGSANLPTATKVGFSFDGWFPTTSGGTAIDGTETINSDITYHAQWTERETETYTVTFKDYDDTTIDTVSVLEGESLGNSMIQNPTRSNYAFAGWYINGNSMMPFTSETTVLNGDITVVAKYKLELNSANITTTPNPLVIKLGKTGQINITSSNGEVVEDCSFTSSNSNIISTDNNGTILGEDIGTVTITITGNLSGQSRTVEATVINKHIVIFDPNNGDTPTELEVNDGTPISGIIPTEPTKTNYIFDRWYLYDEGILTSIPLDQDEIVTEDITYKAGWAGSNKVAAIGNSYYDNLTQAIEAVPLGTSIATEIRILKDATTTDNNGRPTIPNGKSIIINGGSHTLTCHNNNVIFNQGIVRITSGTFTCGYNGKGPIENDTSGVVYIDGGTISNTNNRGAIYNKGKVTITGGELTSPASQRSTVQNVSSGSKITITGGTIIQSNSDCTQGAVENVSGGTITITGGTIISASTKTNGGGVQNTTGGTLTIGTQNNVHNTTTPIIRGMKYGVNSPIDFNFYDGVLEGKEGAISSGITLTTEPNSTAVNEDEVIDSITYHKLYYTVAQTKYTINFINNEGTVNPSSKEFNTNTEITTNDLPIPTRDGLYIFDGWYTDQTLQTPFTAFTPTTADTVNYYAKWSFNSTYTPVNHVITSDAMTNYFNNISTWTTGSTYENHTDFSNSMESNFTANNCSVCNGPNTCSNPGAGTYCEQPKGFVTGLNENLNVYLYENNTKGAQVTYTTSDNGVIYNMIPGKTYLWETNDGTKFGVVTATGARRTIYSPVRNVRDLGGMNVSYTDLATNQTVTGTVKYERLYRGAQITGNQAGADSLTKLGINREIDLRANGDGNSGQPKLTNYDIGTSSNYEDIVITNYHINPVATTYLTDAHLENYKALKKAMKQVMTDVVNGENIYFHCTIGTDRTGTIAYFLEGLLGVSEEERLRDYELTYFYGLTNRDRYHNDLPSTSIRPRFYAMYMSYPTNQDIYDWYRAIPESDDDTLLTAFRNAMINKN